VSRVLAILLLVSALAPGRVHAGATSPTLVLGVAEGEALDGARAARFEGSFDFPNAIQVGYPLQLVIFQGTRFVRVPLVGSPRTGTSTALADDALSEAELPGLLAAGAPAEAGVRIVTVTDRDLRVTLPASFAAGPTRAILFAILPEHPVLSNPIDFVLP
jgi:hypothetical protein